MRRREALALLETALEHGVRHFDVARMYDNGRAEGLLGELAQRRRDDMVIVTKAGILPPNLTRRVLRQGPRFGRFGAGEIRESVERSLRELQTDHVDALLLHECSVSDVTDDLLEVLESLQTAGKARQIGLACTTAQTGPMITAHPHLSSIVQLPVNAAVTAPSGAMRIAHSVVGPRLHRLTNRLNSDAAFAESFTRNVGIQPTDRETIGGLLMQDALTRADIVLFSTSNRERLIRNVAFEQRPPDPAMLAALLPFVNLAAASKRAV